MKRRPDLDKRFAHGDDYAGDAWEDPRSGFIVWTAVGYQWTTDDDVRAWENDRGEPPQEQRGPAPVALGGAGVAGGSGCEFPQPTVVGQGPQPPWLFSARE